MSKKNDLKKDKIEHKSSIPSITDKLPFPKDFIERLKKEQEKEQEKDE